ncbi:MAG: glycine cleavage system aminomethyltransferase GcvT [Planctomycetota bacterium]
MTHSAAPLQITPLNAWHKAHGARMVDFGGWEMPVQYTSIVAEHLTCRKSAALFDTCHMGEFTLTGAGALATLQHVMSRDLTGLKPGQARYGFLTTEQGTVVDDCIAYRLPDDTDGTRYFLCVNAGDIPGDFGWIAARKQGELAFANESEAWAKIDIQGPAAETILARRTPADLGKLKRWRAAYADVAGVKTLISRSGYTGMDGFELFYPADQAVKLWEALLEAGRPEGILPAGLGARDTLRTEACLPLYGHELSREVTPLEANQGWAVSLGKDFVGAAALRAMQAAGVPRQVMPFRTGGKKPARQGAEVRVDGRVVGRVTTGTFSPSLDEAVGMALIETAFAKPGQAVELVVRDKALPAQLVEKPLVQP